MKKIMNVCMPCGIKHGNKDKKIMGMWIGTCDICNEKNILCASAQHDFGIYNNPTEKKSDKIQDEI